MTDVGLKRLAFRQPTAPALMRRAPALHAAEAIRRGGVLGDLRDVGELGGIGIFVEPGGGDAPGALAPVEPRYSVVSSTQVVDIPLRFDFNAHPYLFPAGQPASGEVGFTTIVVPRPDHGPTSRGHAYFRDETAGNVFYYLPDCFLIGQRDDAPFGPQLSFTVGRTTGPPVRRTWLQDPGDNVKRVGCGLGQCDLGRCHPDANRDAGIVGQPHQSR